VGALASGGWLVGLRSPSVAQGSAVLAVVVSIRTQAALGSGACCRRARCSVAGALGHWLCLCCGRVVLGDWHRAAVGLRVHAMLASVCMTAALVGESSHNEGWVVWWLAPVTPPSGQHVGSSRQRVVTGVLLGLTDEPCVSPSGSGGMLRSKHGQGSAGWMGSQVV
jgi:hypothetical protein